MKNLPQMYLSWILCIFVFLERVISEDSPRNFSTRLYSNLFKSVGETFLDIREKEGLSIELRQLTFFLYTSDNRGQEIKLKILNPYQLANSTGKIFFLVHGWHDSKKFSLWYNELTNKLLRLYSDAKIVQLDWEPGSFQDFGSAAYSTESVGSHLATVLNIMVLNHRVPIDQIVLIGHSLGAQICGWAGKYFTMHTNKKLKRIIALDPAGILFTERPDTRRLNRDDAEVVHVIHTDGGNMGFLNQCGTIDFFPNGGHDQPGCSTIDLRNPLKLLFDFIWCNHVRAFEYFLEAVDNSFTLLAHQCSSEEALYRRYCKGTEVGMGDLETTREGLYYLETNSEPPFLKSSE